MNYEKLTNITINTKDLELMCVLLNGDGSHTQKKICVVLTYRPPGGDSKLAFENLRDTVQQLQDVYKYELIILGDLNWDCINDDNENITELCNIFGLSQVIESPTLYS